MVLGGMLTLKAPMLEAYAGFKWVMFHMVFLMEPFWLKPTPKGWRHSTTFDWATWENKSAQGLKLSGALGPPLHTFFLIGPAQVFTQDLGNSFWLSL